MKSLSALRAEGTEFVLATIVATEGSTYRKPGARMLVAPAGRFTDSLAGGAFERGLVDATTRVFADRQPAVIECDMPGPADPGQTGGSERDGIARILLQWQGPQNNWHDAALLEEAIAARAPRVLVAVTDSSHPQVPMGISQLLAGDAAPDLPSDLTQEIAATANAALRTGRPMLVHHPVDEWEVEIFYGIVRPPLGLLIAGAGADSVPLTRIANTLGWNVTVVDPRDWLAQPASFPDADRVLATSPERLPEALGGDTPQAGVIMTHNSALDDRFLRQLLRTDAQYIGILGSKTRCRKLLEGLGELREPNAARIHAPVGLKIGAESAEEIALSIAAEIQSARGDFVEAATAIAAPGGAAEQDLSGLYVVILAAGGAKRFGALKQLLEFEGESLLRRAVKLANEIVFERAIVVHGPKATKCQREIAEFHATSVVNEYWEYGVASSLKLGIRSLPADASAALIILCDQPLVRAPQLQALIERWTGSREKIVAGAYGGTVGVPAIIPRKFFAELMELAGDHGAKSVLSAHERDVLQVPLPEAEMDIDTQDDYTRILTRKPR